jgi:hypothetical protein
VRLHPGYVVRYTPDRNWCREGLAVAKPYHDGTVRLVDTFWGFGSDAHILTGAEAATAELLFDLAAYIPVQTEAEWMRYAETDRRIVTAQHGLTRHYYVRAGAVEDLPTQIENARAALAQAEQVVESAQWRVELARRDLASLESQRVTE